MLLALSVVVLCPPWTTAAVSCCASVVLLWALRSQTRHEVMGWDPIVVVDRSDQVYPCGGCLH